LGLREVVLQGLAGRANLVARLGVHLIALLVDAAGAIDQGASVVAGAGAIEGQLAEVAARAVLPWSTIGSAIVEGTGDVLVELRHAVLIHTDVAVVVNFAVLQAAGEQPEGHDPSSSQVGPGGYLRLRVRLCAFEPHRSEEGEVDLLLNRDRNRVVVRFG
jgi:hypothetical protein